MFNIHDARPGDIFRADTGRGYCYGIVIARIKQLKEKCSLQPGHSLLAHRDKSFIYRLYQTIAESPELTNEDLTAYPLGPAVICGELFEDQHFTLIGQTRITEDLLVFPLLAHEICFVAAHSQAAFMDAIGPEDPYWDTLLGITLEWGTACVQLANKHILPELRHQVRKYCLCAYHSTLGIHSGYAKESPYYEKGRLTLPQEIETVRALLPCFGLKPDSGFDDFAEKWGGMTKARLLELITQESRN